MLMYVCIRMVSLSVHATVLSELCVVCCVLLPSKAFHHIGLRIGLIVP